MVKKIIKYKRGGKTITFKRKVRKKLKNPRRKVSKKIYKRRVLRDSYGQWLGSKSIKQKQKR